MPEVYRPIELPKIERVENYARFCAEIEMESLKYDYNARELEKLQEQNQDLLNKSFDIYGVAKVRSDLAYEVVIATDNVSRNPLLGESRVACYKIDDGSFSTTAFCFGFKKNEVLPTKETSIVLSDHEDPFRRQLVDPDRAPLTYRVFYVPITAHHTVEVLNGLKLVA